MAVKYLFRKKFRMQLPLFGKKEQDSPLAALIPGLVHEFPHLSFQKRGDGMEVKGRNTLILAMEGIDKVHRTENAGMDGDLTVIGVPHAMGKREALNGIKEALYPVAGESRTIEINGKQYLVVRIPTRNRSATARLKGRVLLVKLPGRWSRKDREEIGSRLEKKALRSIETEKWTGNEMPALDFDGCRDFTMLGKEYMVTIEYGKRNSCCRIGNRFILTLRDRKKLSLLMRKEIAKEMLPAVEERVRAFNAEHFGTEIRNIALRDNLSRWGSWSRGRVSLNLRLLFGPTEILDYVIVHELAHSKYLSHGKRFWETVAKAMPDYRERRKWLKDNGRVLAPNSGKV